MTEFGFNTSWTNKPGFVTSEALKGAVPHPVHEAARGRGVRQRRSSGSP